MPMLVKRTSLLLRARKRVALIFSISAVLGMVCPYGSSGGKRNRRRIHHLDAGGFCRALWNAVMVLVNPTIIELDMGKLEDLLQRIDTQDLCAEDYATIHSVIESYVGLFYAVGNKNTTIARLRKMLFGAKTEKTAMVVGQRPPEGIQEAARAALPGGDAPAGEDALKGGSASDASPEAGNDSQAASLPEPGPAPKRYPGHGRNGANAYTAAEKIEVPHPSLQPGDPCPKCETGTVYETNRPGVVVRLVGQAPVGAKVYYLQKLRCNLCGVVFAPDLPPGAGDEKCDATVGSMIALLRYGTGMPMNRNETLQEGLGIPLPASTQWDIVADQAERAEPVFEELIRQAAQGDVLYNDDTTVKILAMMNRQALAEESADEQAEDSAEQVADAAETAVPACGAQSAAEKPEAQRKGMFTTGIIAEIGGEKIALFLSGHQHAGENLKDVLIRRAADLPPPIQMCDALSRNLPRRTEDDPGQLLGARATEVRRCGGAISRGVPPRVGVARGGLSQRRAGQGAESLACGAAALASGRQRPGHGGTPCLAWPAIRRASRGAQLGPGGWHCLHASALGEADALSARGRGAPGQQHLRAGVEDGNPASQELLVLQDPSWCPRGRHLHEPDPHVPTRRGESFRLPYRVGTTRGSGGVESGELDALELSANAGQCRHVARRLLIIDRCWPSSPARH